MQLPSLTSVTSTALLLAGLSHAATSTTSACPTSTTSGTMSVHTDSTAKSGCLTSQGQWDRTSKNCATFQGVSWYPNATPGWGCGSPFWNFTTAKGMCGVPKNAAGQFVIQCAAGNEKTEWFWQVDSGVNGEASMNNLVMPNVNWVFGPNWHYTPNANVANAKAPLDLMYYTDTGDSGWKGPVYQVAFDALS